MKNHTPYSSFSEQVQFACEHFICSVRIAIAGHDFTNFWGVLFEDNFDEKYILWYNPFKEIDNESIGEGKVEIDFFKDNTQIVSEHYGSDNVWLTKLPGASSSYKMSSQFPQIYPAMGKCVTLAWRKPNVYGLIPINQPVHFVRKNDTLLHIIEKEKLKEDIEHFIGSNPGVFPFFNLYDGLLTGFWYSNEKSIHISKLSLILNGYYFYKSDTYKFLIYLCQDLININKEDVVKNILDNIINNFKSTNYYNFQENVKEKIPWIEIWFSLYINEKSKSINNEKFKDLIQSMLKEFEEYMKNEKKDVDISKVNVPKIILAKFKAAIELKQEGANDND